MSTIGPNGEIQDEFQHDGTQHDNLENRHTYYQSHKEARQKWAKEYYQAHKEHKKAYQREYDNTTGYSDSYNQTHTNERRAWNRKKKYGLSQEAYDLLSFSQLGKCAICRKTPEEAGQKTRLTLAVDHDHITNAVRGLLCDRCNSRLGWYERNREIIASYLKKEN